jgi:hypothetical protein
VATCAHCSINSARSATREIAPWRRVVTAPWRAARPSRQSACRRTGAPAEVVDAAEEYTHLLAERVVHLGGTAEGTIQVATTRTGLKEYPLAHTDERDHVEALSSALAAYGKGVRRAIEQTDALGDQDTADIFTEISRGVDKYLWFVEAHLGSPGVATRKNPC